MQPILNNNSSPLGNSPSSPLRNSPLVTAAMDQMETSPELANVSLDQLYNNNTPPIGSPMAPADQMETSPVHVNPSPSMEQPVEESILMTSTPVCHKSKRGRPTKNHPLNPTPRSAKTAGGGDPKSRSLLV